MAKLIIDPVEGTATRVFKNGAVRNVGYTDPDGYVFIRVGASMVGLHRVVWEHHHGETLGDRLVDHEDGNPSNNKIANLRVATYKINAENRHRPQTNNVTTGVKGVSLDRRRGKYRACIAVNSRNFHLGYFDTIEQAALAYAEGARKHHLHNPHAMKKAPAGEDRGQGGEIKETTTKNESSV
jgi:hypothetical protein